MTSPRLFTLASSLALFLFASDSAFAKAPSNSRGQHRFRGNTQPTPTKIKSTTETTIEKMGSLSITVKTGNETRNYGIEDHTQIFVARLRSNVGALKKGMRVSVHPSTLDPTVAQSITVDDPAVRAAEASKPAAPKPGAANRAMLKKSAQPKKK